MWWNRTKATTMQPWMATNSTGKELPSPPPETLPSSLVSWFLQQTLTGWTTLLVLGVVLQFTLLPGVIINVRMINEYVESSVPHILSGQKNESNLVVPFTTNRTNATHPPPHQPPASHASLIHSRVVSSSSGIILTPPPEQQQQQQAVIPIFYNIYIPDDNATGGEGTQRAFRIVSEQLRQVADSFAGGGPHHSTINNTKGTQRPVQLHYVTVGPTNLLPEQLMKNSGQFCGAYSNFQCQHLAHLPVGDESFTLDQVGLFHMDLYPTSQFNTHPHGLTNPMLAALLIDPSLLLADVAVLSISSS
jgi:hypothetical protein